MIYPRPGGAAPPVAPSSGDAVSDLSNAMMQGWLQAQRMPFEALLAWQRWCAASQKELWDEWLCHFAGGARIDD